MSSSIKMTSACSLMPNLIQASGEPRATEIRLTQVTQLVAILDRGVGEQNPVTDQVGALVDHVDHIDCGQRGLIGGKCATVLAQSSARLKVQIAMATGRRLAARAWSRRPGNSEIASDRFEFSHIAPPSTNLSSSWTT